MKNFSFFILFLTQVCLVKAIDDSYACLGILCYVNVDLSSDPVDSEGFLTYTIRTPSENLAPNYGVQGPGSPRLTNNLGSTVDLKLRRSHLALEADGRNCELVIDVLVNKWSSGWGSYTSVKPAYGD